MKNLIIQSIYTKCIATTLIVSLGVSNVLGQEAELAEKDDVQSSESQFETIIITAQKRENRMHDVPIAMSVMVGEALEALGIDSADTLQDFVPGLSISGDAPGTNTVSIRGIADLGFGLSPVGYYMDETPISVISSSMPELMMWDLQRVEVLRGPQGTLFGDGSMGGTLRFISNKPDAQELYGRISVSGETIDMGGSSYNTKALLNVPVSDTLAIRISSTYKDMSGWIDNPELNEKDTNNYDQLDARIAVRWIPNDALIADFSYIHEEINMGHRNTATSPGIFDPLPLFPPGLGLPQAQVNNEFKDYDIINLTLDWDVGFASLVSATSRFERNVTSQTDWSPFGLVYFGYLTSGGTGIANVDIDTSITTQELRLVSYDDQELDWTVGVFYKLDESSDFGGWDFDLTDFDLSVFGGPYIGDFSESERNIDNSESKSWSVFADIDYELTQQLSIQLGIRYYQNKRESETITVVPSMLFGDFSGAGEGEDSTVAPKLALNWEINDNLMVFAKVSKGFRSGGVNITAQGSNVLGFPMPLQYDAESLWTYEAGIKAQPLDWMRTNFYIFHNDWEDMQLANTTAIGWGFIENVGKSKSDGMELELQTILSDNLRVNLNLSYIDAAVDEIAGSTGASPILPGNDLPFVPKWSGSIVIDYTKELGNGLQGRITGNYGYRDKTFSAATNLPNELTTTYGQLSIRAGVESERWSLYAYASNLLNDADVTRSAPQISGVPLVFKTYVQPRTLGLELQLRF